MSRREYIDWEHYEKGIEGVSDKVVKQILSRPSKPKPTIASTDIIIEEDIEELPEIINTDIE